MASHFWISTSYYTCAITSRKGIIVKAAPILEWAVGKRVVWLRDYLFGKGVLLQWKQIKVRRRKKR